MLIAPRMETWRDIAIVHRGQPVAIDGVGFSAIGRLRVAATPAAARTRGRRRRSRSAPPSRRIAELADYDLIVAADGVNSLRAPHLRGANSAPPLSHLARASSPGTARPSRFDTLTQTFVANELGTFNAHHYRYAPDMSTFIVECDPATWVRAGLDRRDEAESRAHLRAGVCRHAGRPSARLQPLDLAQLSLGVERALVATATSC